MEREMELYHAVYFFLLTQIRFGFYRHRQNLPTMEELCKLFHISIDTAKPVYHRLRQEGYIVLSQKAGAKVAVEYSPEQINHHVQQYFSHRKAALLDLNQSTWPLLGWAQWLSVKNSSPETVKKIQHAALEEIMPPNAVWHYLEQKYGALGNALLLRLLRYIYFFFHGPYYSVRENSSLVEKGFFQQKNLMDLRRRGDWDALASALFDGWKDFAESFVQFYDENITIQQPPPPETVFRWDAYQKSSQLRYTLAIELLTDISRGIYPEGSYLPSAERLSAEKGVSVSTVRRTIQLLNNIGAVKSSRPLGARVLPPAQSTQNCDFSQPDIQRRLLDLTASLQIFALSAKAVSEMTLSSLDADSIRQWKQRLYSLQKGSRYELITYSSLELISNFAPYQTIRIIYSELLRLLFWGNPLRGMRGNPEAINLFFAPYFNRAVQALEEREFSSFSTILEELLLHELRVTVDGLIQLGIQGAETILVPSTKDSWTFGNAGF